MDTELQIRLNFLDEAEEYFDRIESNLVGLANSPVDPQQVDLMLRAAHSVKGGAGMMQFPTLSKVAHRLEDFFKIIRVRYAASSLSIEVENLLLLGVDCLRRVSQLYRQGLEIEDSWFDKNAEPIFASLRQHLGKLEAADEDALMSQDEDIDPALLMFEEGVDAILDRFETELKELRNSQLPTELTATANELVAFGQMANLEPFIALCEDVVRQAETLSDDTIQLLARDALTTWRRSHALVMRGRVEKLPSRLEGDNLSPTAIIEASELETSEVLSTTEALDLFEAPPEELSDLNLESATEIDDDWDLLADDAFDAANVSSLQAELDVKTPEEASRAADLQKQSEIELAATPQPQVQQAASSAGKMVRVPLEQLKQFNNLFEKLVLERNSINLRLKQLQNMSALMGKRMQQIEQSNTQLKQWYDRASIQGVLHSREPSLAASTAPTFSGERASNLSTSSNRQFDLLEMDRYSDIHLICQEQIETIVQLQEVTTDIELGLQDLNQVVRELDRTTKSLQGNVTRTQMLPFAEIVKRFPRLVRDLSLQFGKQVNLKIEGENTLIDRSAVETLSDPLIHLLRNAFDHGIEDAATRIAAGKPSEGTITIRATNKSTETVITISDDGGGISVDKIRDRLSVIGISNEYIAKTSEAELLNCIFEPGFSTAKQVTELSGRGVGMDVVRNNLREIRGQIQVETQPGFGTTFTLKVPFTLSIIRVMIVEQSGIVFAVPASSVPEILQLKPELLMTTEDTEQLLWNERAVSLIRVEQSLIFRRSGKSFRLADKPVIERSMALVVKDGAKCFGLHIDRFWGELDATIRPIESPVSLPPGFVSSMILEDGRVIPVVDPIALVESCLRSKSVTEAVEPATTQPTLPVPGVSVQNNTILIVDDSINVRRYLGLTLEKAGYQVEQARDGREAVDKLLGGLVARAVICDIEMPRLDGYGVLEEIKGRSEYQNLPIAMLTSRSNEKHRKLAMNLGASAYFSKPYNEQKLLQKLAELINE